MHGIIPIEQLTFSGWDEITRRSLEPETIFAQSIILQTANALVHEMGINVRNVVAAMLAQAIDQTAMMGLAIELSGLFPAQARTFEDRKALNDFDIAEHEVIAALPEGRETDRAHKALHETVERKAFELAIKSTAVLNEERAALGMAPIEGSRAAMNDFIPGEHAEFLADGELRQSSGAVLIAGDGWDTHKH